MKNSVFEILKLQSYDSDNGWSTLYTFSNDQLDEARRILDLEKQLHGDYHDDYRIQTTLVNEYVGASIKKIYIAIVKRVDLDKKTPFSLQVQISNYKSIEKDSSNILSTREVFSTDLATNNCHYYTTLASVVGCNKEAVCNKLREIVPKEYIFDTLVDFT